MAAPNQPLFTPPSGGDRNRGWVITVTGIVFTTIATILVLARLYLRSYVKKNFGSDDLFIVFGLIFAIVESGVEGVLVHNGVGRHLFYLEASPIMSQRLSRVVELLKISQLFFISSTLFTRISISLFLLRIFGTVRTWKWLLYGILALLSVVNIVSALIVLVEISSHQEFSSDASLGLRLYNGVVAVFSDWALASFPVLFMWKVQMSVKDKAGVCVLMGMGFFSGICALIRTVKFVKLDSSDILWDYVPSIIWAELEATVGIIAACIPTVKPLFDNPFLCRGRKLAGKRPEQVPGGDDDKRRLQPSSMQNVHGKFRVAPDVHLRDGGERHRVEVEGGRQRSSLEMMDLGREDTSMTETSFGPSEGDISDHVERSWQAGEESG